MRLDSHHHFWNYSAEQYGWINDEMSVLKRDFSPADLLAEIGPCGIDGVVSVQARQTVEETEWLLSLADSHDFIRGVVGWLPLASAEIEDHLERFSQCKKLRAIRHVVQDEPDDAFILGEDFNRGISQLHSWGFVYDILIFAKHLANSIKFVDQHPGQIFVLDHIAKPTIVSSQFDKEWATNLRELAKRTNVFCKFSGVVTEVRDDSWTLDTIAPYWDVALEAFGSDRLMYGSDWPVCLLKSEYRRWYDSVAQLAQRDLNPAEQNAFWGANAIRAYQLD